MDRHGRQVRPAVAGERAPVLHRELEPRRRGGWLRFEPAWCRVADDGCDLPGQQLRRRNPSGQSRAASADGERDSCAFPQLGDERDAAASVRWPRLSDKTLAEASKNGIGFPKLPVLRPTVPEPDFINPLIDYDFGPQFNYVDGAGVPTIAPPKIRQVLKMFAPRVDADGNEMGGVPVVLLDAPLGTYLGWNITAAGACRSTRARSATTSAGCFRSRGPRRRDGRAAIRGRRSRSGMDRMTATSRR